MENKTTTPNKRPVKVNGYSHRKADARKDRRRDEADARQDKYDSLTVEQKISRAKKRRGKSEREINRLINRAASKKAA